ncbi:MAG: hypothetical protein AMS15_06865, partial [Planctomycetes bacterium DG_23]
CGLKDFLIRGVLDAAFLGSRGKWKVLDYKTDAIEASEVEKRAGHYQAQIDAYSLASQKIFDGKIEEIVFYFLTPRVSHRTAITAEFLKGAKGRLTDLISKIHLGEFPANTHQCPYCAFNRICPEERD